MPCEHWSCFILFFLSLVALLAAAHRVPERREPRRDLRHRAGERVPQAQAVARHKNSPHVVWRAPRRWRRALLARFRRVGLRARVEVTMRGLCDISAARAYMVGEGVPSASAPGLEPRAGEASCAHPMP